MKKQLFRAGFLCNGVGWGERHLARGTVALSVAASLTVGCGGSPDGQSYGEEIDVGTATSALVGTLVSTNAAETQVSFGASSYLVAYNGDDPNHILYTDTDRFIFPGASGTGMSKCTGTSCTRSQIYAPSGWSVTWGDPGLSGRSGYQVLSSLGIPNEKMPSYIQGAVDPGGLPANYGGAYIGGICVARSVDDGGTIYRTDCLRKTSTSFPYGVFNDGSSAFTNGVAASGNGPAYVASNDVTNGLIDVYLATGKDQPFNRMPTPFPGLDMESHPRLITDSLGYIHVLALDAGGRLLLTKFSGFNTLSGSWSTPLVVATGVVAYPDVVLSDRTIRNGPQFSGVFGLNDYVGGGYEFRAIYTVKVGSSLHVHGARCTNSLATCTQVSGWSTDSSASDQFNPLIAYTAIGPAGPNRTGEFKITYYSRERYPTGNKIEIIAGRFMMNSGGSSTFQHGLFVDPQVPCPDLRGYFGDYDDFKWDSVSGKFGRTYTDSSTGTCVRKGYTSSPLNVNIAFTSP